MPSSQHSSQGHNASCRLTQPWEPKWTLENLQEKAALWYGVLEGSRVVTGAHSSCQAVRRKVREVACRPRKLELFQGCCQLCCKKLLLARASHSLMRLSIFLLSKAATDASLAAGAQDSCIPRGGVLPRGILWPFLMSPRSQSSGASIPTPKDVHAGPVS